MPASVRRASDRFRARLATTSRRVRAALPLREFRCLSLVAATSLAFAPCALALSPDLLLTQFHHTAWTAQDGAPTGIEALAQTSDGYLWIAGSAGLFRFDGVRFERVERVGGERLPSTNVMSLFAARPSGLWVGYRFGGASFIYDGGITSYGEQEGLPVASLTHFAQDASGAMWASTSGGLKRFDGSRWHDMREALALPSDYVKTMHIARDGTLWVVFGRSVMFLAPDAHAFVAADIETGEGDVDFVEAPDGTLWVTDASLGARAVSGPGASHGAPADWIRLQDDGAEPVWGRLVDRDGALWAVSSTGIHRMRDPARVPGASADARDDLFAEADGLTAAYASAFLEDREGNVWIGTAGGLDRFRESRLTPVPLPRAANGFALAAGADGAMLVGIDADAGLFSLTGPSTVESLSGPQYVTSAYRADDGVVWLGGRGMLWHSGGADWVPLDIPVDRDNKSYYPVQGIAQDRAGRLWVSVVRGGVYLFDRGAWTRFGDAALSVAAGADGRVWLGYPHGRIRLIRHDGDDTSRLLSSADGLDIGNVLAILPGPDDAAWVGGELGLARFDGDRFHVLARRGGAQFPTVSGIVATPDGNLWLGTSEGAMRLDADEVRRVIADDRHEVRYELFDFRDGMTGTPDAIRPLPSVAAGLDGRLWFATSNGIVWIDPAHIAHNALAPAVTVQSVVADGTRYEPADVLTLPRRVRHLQINYTALSLSIPERVRFRYRLGSDEPWQDAGARRAAFFTDPDPGDYAFSVIAANDDGVWSASGVQLAFTIPPAFHQTRWFIALCALAALAVLTGLYGMRVRHVAAQVHGRLQARLAERERIARELHDTLLQGMQGLIWHFQAAADRIQPGEPSRALMEQALDRADRLLAEGRDRVKGLRPVAAEIADLAQALAAEGTQFANAHAARFSVSVQGAARELHPIVREEGFLIAREALANAFLHARAESIEAELTYGASALQVRIRDDGRGIAAALPDAAAGPAHFGVMGMRERAKRLGARLDLWSRPGAGTEIELRVPAHVAYADTAARGVRVWLARLRSAIARRDAHTPEQDRS